MTSTTTETETTSTPRPFEIGLYSFAELTPDPSTGHKISPAERIRNLLEEIELAQAKQLGLEVFKYDSNDEMLKVMGLLEYEKA